MKLSQNAIEEFKAIYQEEFRELLTDAEAQEMGERLLRLFQILCHPSPSDADNSPRNRFPQIDSSLRPDNMGTG